MPDDLRSAAKDRQKHMRHAIATTGTRTEATEALRGLIDAIALTPEQGALRSGLKGQDVRLRD